jgi:hypothetical protein
MAHNTIVDPADVFPYARMQVKAAGQRLVVATPRVLKPDEQGLGNFYLRLGADALLVRSTGLLHALQQIGGAGAQPLPYWLWCLALACRCAFACAFCQRAARKQRGAAARSAAEGQDRCAHACCLSAATRYTL